MQAEEKRFSAAALIAAAPRQTRSIATWLEAASPRVLLLPTVIIVLALSVFPLIVSLYLSLSRFQFVRGGFQLTFIGFRNYEKLLFGSEQRHTLGRLAPIEPIWWIPLIALGAIMAYLLFRYVTSTRLRIIGLILRLLTIFITGGLALLAASTLSGDGLPGTLIVTLIFVFASVIVQYLIGLGLALLLTQNLTGKRFFRILFLLPMMITPVGIGFLFKMLTNTTQGPFAPLWIAAGLADFSWASSASGARLAVIIGDVWQWTPFMFIILLAALEGVSRETIEAGLVDGASRFQLFRFIVLPEIVPVSTTVILIRLIETFKIVDMPNILTGGGPGTATESLTLHAYNSWRALDLGSSSAVAYILLFTVTFVAMVFVNIVRKRVLQLAGAA